MDDENRVAPSTNTIAPTNFPDYEAVPAVKGSQKFTQ